MNLDNRNFFCDNKALSDETATTDWIDTVAGGGVMANPAMTIFISGKVTATGGTSVNFEVQTSDDKSVIKTVAVTPEIATVNLTSGTFWARIPWPRGLRRYVRLKQNVTGVFTAGKHTSFVASGESVSFETL